MSRRYFLGALGMAAAAAVMPVPGEAFTGVYRFRIQGNVYHLAPRQGAFLMALQQEMNQLISDMCQVQSRAILGPLFEPTPRRPIVKVRRAPGQLKKRERKARRKALWRRQN